MVTQAPRQPLTYERPVLWNVMKPGSKPYQPLAWQVRHMHKAVDAGYKRIALPCGRRAGKSEGVQAEIVREATKPGEEVLGIMHHPLIYVVGPTADLATRVWLPIWNMFVPSEDGSYTPPLGLLYKSHNKQDGIITLKNGTILKKKSGDDPRGLQGERVTLAVVDEAQDMTNDAWANLIPGLADGNGLLIAIGIARGRGRFRSLYRLGKEHAPLHYAASVPTHVNPVMHMAAQKAGYDDLDRYIEEVLASGLTPTEIRQHYYAEFVDEEGTVFRNPEAAFIGDPLVDVPDPQDGHVYFAGLDLAKVYDYTTCYVADGCCGKVVARYRVHGLDYTIQVPQIVRFLIGWKVRMVKIDEIGSQGTIDYIRLGLAGTGCSVLSWRSTTEEKGNHVSKLVRDIERIKLIMPKDDSVALGEMQAFEATVSGNNVKYGAPSGYHDDCVSALYLVNALVDVNRGIADTGTQQPYLSFGAKSRARTKWERQQQAGKQMGKTA